jgi:hypothetical protein
MIAIEIPDGKRAEPWEMGRQFGIVEGEKTRERQRLNGLRELLFTYKIQRYALEQRKRGVVKALGG